MEKFIAVELNWESGELTGKTEYYLAESYNKAVEAVLYTKKISNGNAYIGNTGKVVYSGMLAYVLYNSKLTCIVS